MQKIDDWRWTFFTVDLELTNLCRHKCVFCPREKISRPKGFIDVVFAKKLIAELGEIGSRITFCGMGDPLLHPELGEIAKYCRSINGLSFGITVQASSLDAENRKRLVEARPGFIEISFPTTDKNLFSELIPGSDYKVCLDNIVRLIEEKGDCRGISIIAVSTGKETISSQKTIEFWADMGLHCRVSSCHSRGGNFNKATLLTAEAQKREFCGLFALHAFISWEGKLLACCHDLSGATAIADLKSDAIQNTGYRKVSILNKKMPFKICSGCDEPAANRVVPERPFPESAGARRRVLKAITR
ncbi:MAG: hypothetical protein Kow0029_11340 [Candidatus Rifleibacteriota bacterium]